MPNLIHASAQQGAWYSGEGVPLAALGADGDYYRDEDARIIYKKDAGAWASISLDSTGGGFVPTFIASDETFTVPAHRQALFAMTIDNEGTLVVLGSLIEVN